MLAATSRRNAVLHRAASSNVRGGTKRVFVRLAIDALAMTAIPQAAELPLCGACVRMTSPRLRDEPSDVRLGRRDNKERFIAGGQSCGCGNEMRRSCAHTFVNASCCRLFRCLAGPGAGAPGRK